LEGLVDPIAATAAAVVYLYIRLSVCMSVLLLFYNCYLRSLSSSLRQYSEQPQNHDLIFQVSLSVCLSVCVSTCMSGSLPPVFCNCNLPRLSSSSRQYP
jgi:hypothetical protein